MNVRALADLARAAATGLQVARGQPDVREAEIFAAANGILLARLCYTSHIPCNGVEEPKSVTASGIGVQAVFDGPDGPRLGFGSEPGDLSSDAAARALDKARQAAVGDPGFVCLPRPTGAPRLLREYHDPDVMALDDARLVQAGWAVVHGALRTFLASRRLAALAPTDASFRRLGLIVGGDVTVRQERMAIASTAMPEPQTDESTLLTAFVTAMVESHAAKGSASSAATRLDDLTDEAGVAAARAALDAMDGERVASGRYAVVFGHQPVADLVTNLVVPACRAGSFYTMNTPFLGRLGARVASPALRIYDDGARPRGMASKGLTCEGLPTGRTDLIRDGRLAGCLSSWYETQRLLRDPRLATLLGGDSEAARAAALAPRNGFRFGNGGGRDFDTRPRVSATNVVVEGADPVGRETLLARVGEGLYVGRIWYCYPINGLRAGDFTCTVVADSYIIRGGRIVAPLRPNAIRIDDNIVRVLADVIGVGAELTETIVWAADEAVYAPEIAVADVRVEQIADDMEDPA